jgi:DNA replication and repair protein RecF
VTGVRLVQLRAVQFRNHRHSEITPAPGVTVLVGDNAQGKSSLLEAAQVAATARSFRARRDAEMIMHGETWARVRVLVERGGRSEEIAVALRRDAAGDRDRVARELRVNGVAVRRGELFGRFLCVLAAPDDIEIVTGSPRHRRRLCDLLLAQISPAYYDTAQRYARALAQRNHLLRLRGRGLEAWDEQIAVLGAAITARRRRIVARLAAAVRPIYAALSGGGEDLSVAYAPAIAADEEAEMIGWARAALLRRRSEEQARGMTLVGPHRDDLVLRVNGRDLRTFGSRGQHLTAMLAMRLAERRVVREETGEEPVLLLDDVLLALDPSRQASLLDGLRGTQVLVTMTAAMIPPLPEGAAYYRVAGGTVEAVHAHRA